MKRFYFTCSHLMAICLMCVSVFTLSSCGGDDDDDTTSGGKIENNAGGGSSTNTNNGSGSSINANNHEYVDLGLPSGTLWATCNIGASKPEEYGAYFARGETQPKSDYSWSTYKWCNGNKDSMTKYCTNSSYGILDNKTTLELSDDAAYINWGRNWRMPTFSEQEELRNSCTWLWTYKFNGVAGWLVVSKTNGNSIFLPATGYKNGYSFYEDDYLALYWSSSLYSNNSAYTIKFHWDEYDWYCPYRSDGAAVRPVMKN